MNNPVLYFTFTLTYDDKYCGKDVRFYIPWVFIGNRKLYCIDIQFATGFVLRGGLAGVTQLV